MTATTDITFATQHPWGVEQTFVEDAEKQIPWTSQILLHTNADLFVHSHSRQRAKSQRSLISVYTNHDNNFDQTTQYHQPSKTAKARSRTRPSNHHLYKQRRNIRSQSQQLLHDHHPRYPRGSRTRTLKSRQVQSVKSLKSTQSQMSIFAPSFYQPIKQKTWENPFPKTFEIPKKNQFFTNRKRSLTSLNKKDETMSIKEQQFWQFVEQNKLEAKKSNDVLNISCEYDAVPYLQLCRERNKTIRCTKGPVALIFDFFAEAVEPVRQLNQAKLTFSDIDHANSTMCLIELLMFADLWGFLNGLVTRHEVASLMKYTMRRYTDNPTEASDMTINPFCDFLCYLAIIIYSRPPMNPQMKYLSKTQKINQFISTFKFNDIVFVRKQLKKAEKSKIMSQASWLLAEMKSHGKRNINLLGSNSKKTLARMGSISSVCNSVAKCSDQSTNQQSIKSSKRTSLASLQRLPTYQSSEILFTKTEPFQDTTNNSMNINTFTSPKNSNNNHLSIHNFSSTITKSPAFRMNQAIRKSGRKQISQSMKNEYSKITQRVSQGLLPQNIHLEKHHFMAFHRLQQKFVRQDWRQYDSQDGIHLNCETLYVPVARVTEQQRRNDTSIRSNDFYHYQFRVRILNQSREQIRLDCQCNSNIFCVTYKGGYFACGIEKIVTISTIPQLGSKQFVQSNNLDNEATSTLTINAISKQNQLLSSVNIPIFYRLAKRQPNMPLLQQKNVLPPSTALLPPPC